MMQGNDPASLPLRDIHLPDSISWWPLAPGWWLLLLVTLFIASLVYWLIRRHRAKRCSVAFIVRQEMRRIRDQFDKNRDNKLLAQELSEIVRRVAISVFAREDTASLLGEDWLRFLDRTYNGTEFTQGEGRALIEAPYRAQPEFDAEQLLSLVENWIHLVTNNKAGVVR